MKHTDSINSKLELSPDEMRKLGYQVVDMLVEHYQTVADKPVLAHSSPSRAEMEARFHEPLPQHAMGLDKLLQEVLQDVLEQSYHPSHPRAFAYVNAPSNFVGVLADTLREGYDVISAAWRDSPAVAMIELVTLDWLRQIIGMPENTGGIFTSGGSIANLTGLAVARHVKLANDLSGAVVYCSGQTHFASTKALPLLGLRADQLCKLPVDSDFRLSLPALVDAVAADRKQGKRPFCVIANAGTTNTGAVDPLPEIAAFCRENDLWLHVDGAYGAGAVLSDKGRAALRGIELADSLAIDPHKWLFQPYELGCILVRDRRQLWETFNISAEYLKHLVDPSLEEVNFFEYGIELTRGFRALKLWMSLKAFGIESFKAAVSRGLENAEIAEHHLRQSPKWQIITPAQLGIITFRYHVEGLSDEQLDALNDQIADRITADGFAFVHTTILNGRTVLRLVMINPRTTDEDIAETVRRLEHFGDAIIKEN
jgi:aromatic-L-amino-acid decarboxylase